MSLCRICAEKVNKLHRTSVQGQGRRWHNAVFAFFASISNGTFCELHSLNKDQISLCDTRQPPKHSCGMALSLYYVFYHYKMDLFF